MGMEDVLRIDKILYFCDVPQLFVARDAFDTLYLCLLYDDETVYRYTGIRISTRRLESFLAGKADLRLLYLQPENEHEYYDVVFQSGEYQKTLLKESVLLEDKLPAEGYVLSGEKRENVVINLPIKDRSLLADRFFAIASTVSLQAPIFAKLETTIPFCASASKLCSLQRWYRPS